MALFNLIKVMKIGKRFERRGFRGVVYDDFSEDELDRILDKISQTTRCNLFGKDKMPIETDEDYRRLGERFDEDE